MKDTSILWSNEPTITLHTIEQWNEKVGYFIKNGFKVEKSKTKHIDWLKDNSYRIDKRYNVMTLYTTYNELDNYDAVKYELRLGAEKLDRTDADGTTYNGTNSRKWLDAKVRERTGKSLRLNFGVVDNNAEFSGFMYAPIIWTDAGACRMRRLKNIYKADVCSAYGYEASKKLPDAHTAITRNGRIAPNEEYQFAYYIKSNQLAIYDEFDTHDYVNHTLNYAFNNYNDWLKKCKPYRNRLHYIETPDNEEITILMKEASTSLFEEFNELYNCRKDKPYYKSIYVSAIGNIASNSRKINGNNEMRHITSLIYARHFVRMCEIYDALEDAGAFIISISTDSIIWASLKDLTYLYSNEKKFGAFHIEYKKANIRIFRQGVYAVEMDGEIELIKKQGLAEEIETFNKKLEDLDFIERIKPLKVNKDGVIV